MAIKPVPEGFHTVTPYLVVKGADALVDFITRAFGAKEVHLMKGPSGEIRHGDLIVGDSHVMLGEADGPWPPQPCSSTCIWRTAMPCTERRSPPADTSIQEPKTQFYGDRHGAVKDPCGNTWWIATPSEDVSPQEMEKRAPRQRNGRRGRPSGPQPRNSVSLRLWWLVISEGRCLAKHADDVRPRDDERLLRS